MPHAGSRARVSPPPNSVTLHFLTPTTFRRSPPLDGPFDHDTYNLPFPLPELVFGGLLSPWNAFGPQPLPGELRTFARDCVVVSRYRLRTERVDFGSGRRGAPLRVPPRVPPRVLVAGLVAGLHCEYSWQAWRGSWQALGCPWLLAGHTRGAVHLSRATAMSIRSRYRQRLGRGGGKRGGGCFALSLPKGRSFVQALSLGYNKLGGVEIQNSTWSSSPCLK